MKKQDLASEQTIPSRPYDLSFGSYNSQPDFAIGPDGNQWVVWAVHQCDYDKEGYPRSPTSHVYLRCRDIFPHMTCRLSTGIANWAPKLAVRSASEVWTFWSSWNERHWSLRARAFEGGELGDQLILADTGCDWMPAVTLIEGNMWIVWQTTVDRVSAIALAQFDGLQLTQPTILSDKGMPSYTPAIATVDNDTVLVFWEEYAGHGFSIRACLCKQQEKEDSWNLGCGNQPAVAGDPAHGTAWAAWRSVQDGQGLVRVAALEQDNIKQPALPSTEDKPASSRLGPQLLVDKQGILWLFWCDFHGWQKTEIWARPLSQEGWAEPVQLTHARPGYASPTQTCAKEFSVACDNGCNLWMAWMNWQTNNGPCTLNVRCLDELTGIARAGKPPLETLQLSALAPVLKPKAIERYCTSVDGQDCAVYFGDLHGHSHLSFDGWGQPHEYFSYARDIADLDFCTLADHDPTRAEQGVSEAVADAFNEPGRFVAISAYEDVFAAPSLGDKVVYLFDKTVEPRWCLEHIGEALLPRRLVWDQYEGKRVLIISHDGAWSQGIFDPTEWDEIIEPVIQISSTHTGAVFQEFEYFREGENKRSASYLRYHDALKQGFRFGVVGGSDTHGPTPQVRTALYLPELTRDAMYHALKTKRCYALTGEKINLDVRIDGHLMGTTASVDQETHSIEIIAQAANSIVKAELVCNLKTAATVENDTNTLTTTLEHTCREDVCYYVRIFLANGHMAWSSPVWLLNQESK